MHERTGIYKHSKLANIEHSSTDIKYVPSTTKRSKSPKKKTFETCYNPGFSFLILYILPMINVMSGRHMTNSKYKPDHFIGTLQKGEQ